VEFGLALIPLVTGPPSLVKSSSQMSLLSTPPVGAPPNLVKSSSQMGPLSTPLVGALGETSELNLGWL